MDLKSLIMSDKAYLEKEPLEKISKKCYMLINSRDFGNVWIHFVTRIIGKLFQKKIIKF